MKRLFICIFILIACSHDTSSSYGGTETPWDENISFIGHPVRKKGGPMIQKVCIDGYLFVIATPWNGYGVAIEQAKEKYGSNMVPIKCKQEK